MSKGNNQLLRGENITPNNKAEIQPLIGNMVEYLRDIDIDKSGRGYFLPRRGIVEGCKGRNIIIDGDYIWLKSIKEMRLEKE